MAAKSEHSIVQSDAIFINGEYYDSFWKKNGCCLYMLKNHPEVISIFPHTRFILFKTKQSMSLKECKEKFSFCRKCNIIELLF